MFSTLQDRLTATFKNLRGKGKLSDADIDATLREIRVALLEADVALPVVKDFVAAVRERAKSAEVSQALNPAQQVVKIVNDELVEILGGQTRRIRFAKTPPTVVMLAGLQGAGKTTLAGKLGLWLKSQGHQPLLVAADLQRPNAVQQLQVVGERADVAVFAPEAGSGVGDPVKVAQDSIVFAREKLYDVVVVDTAGRLGVDEDMMQQARDIRDAVQPDEVLFVVDAMVGQDALATAEAFLGGVGFDGVVLTKLDGDARGGAALSVRGVTGRPILFASNGEKLEDFDAFHPERMASRILDMGDLLTLIEQAEKVFERDQAEQMAAKLATGTEFTLEDFLTQLQAVQKMGSMGKLLGMLPGMSEHKEAINNLDDREFDRIRAIIQSMTPGERADVKVLNGSRRQRIASGSGTQVSDVNQLVTRFLEARKMMSQMAKGGGVPGMPGMPGLGGGLGGGLGAAMGGGRAKKGKKAGKKGKKGRVSGNPAKRAQQAAQGPGDDAVPETAPEASLDELPPEFMDLLKGS
ncbi:MAG: signal recognition particle protein [Actinomycetes bacterium]